MFGLTNLDAALLVAFCGLLWAAQYGVVRLLAPPRPRPPAPRRCQCCHRNEVTHLTICDECFDSALVESEET